MFISPQEMGYSLPNVYMTYPKAQPRQVSQQKQSNVALSREAGRRGFKSVAEMQAAAKGGGAGGARVVSQKGKLEAARKQWAEKSQAEAQKRVAEKARWSSIASQTYADPYAANAQLPTKLQNPYVNYDQLQHLSPGSLDSYYALDDAGLAVGYSGYGGMPVTKGRDRIPYANAYWAQGR